MSPVAPTAARAAAPLLFALALLAAPTAGAQQLAATRGAAPGVDAREETAALRFEAVVALPDTLTLAELSRGVPLLLQAVTSDGRPVRTKIAWRVVTGASTRIAAEGGTNAQGFATATFDREPMALARPGRVVIEATMPSSGARPATTLRLSSVVVARR